MKRIMIIASALALLVGLPASADIGHSVTHTADTKDGQTWTWTLSDKTTPQVEQTGRLRSFLIKATK